MFSASASAATLSVSPQLLRILDGRDATFHCRVIGSEGRAPRVTWSKVDGVGVGGSV